MVLGMMEISWTNHVRNKEALLRVNKERNILHAIKKKKGQLDWLHLAQTPSFKHVIEGKIKWM
jgi:hypothetical protein